MIISYIATILQDSPYQYKYLNKDMREVTRFILHLDLKGTRMLLSN
jgi:hypothetical protein